MTKQCVGKDALHRMNYLLQASECIATVAAGTNNITHKSSLEFISNYYTNLSLDIAKKSVLRIDSEIKRTICKRCHTFLIPGETCRVRIRKKPRKKVRWLCLKCGAVRVYNTNRDHTIWNERPEALEKTDQEM